MAGNSGAADVGRVTSNAIGLISLLSAARGSRVTRAEARRALQVDEQGLEQAMHMVGNLFDRESGARAIIIEEGDCLALEGDAATMPIPRLTVGEGLVLAEAMGALDLEPGIRERIASALLPFGVEPAAPNASFIDSTPYGPSYLVLEEAIRYGIRCTIDYRSSTDRAARRRTVDPLALEVDAGMPYLTAWDLDRDAQRRYRLDRLSSASFTDESVERHHWKRGDIAKSLREAGDIAVLAFSSERDARWRSWAGMGEIIPMDDGRARADVAFTSKPWLFDQLLAAGGSIEILEPEELKDELDIYASTLRID